MQLIELKQTSRSQRSGQISATTKSNQPPNADEFVPDLPDCLQLVKGIAGRLARRLPRSVPFEDLLSAGNVGLAAALNTFDPTKAAVFAHYASFRIRGAMLDHLRQIDVSPRELRSQQRELERAMVTLTQRLGRSPESVDIAAELGMPLEELYELQADIDGRKIGDFYKPSVQDPEEYEVVDPPAPEAENPLALFLKSEQKEQLVLAIQELPERLQMVLALRYQEDISFREISFILNVSDSRVSQMHTEAIRKIRARLC